MKKVELESFVKSFFLFFLSQTLLVGVLFFIYYNKEMQTLDESIFSKMRVCSYSLRCKEFDIGFVPAKKYERYKLYKDDKALSSYFPIPQATKNDLKIFLPIKKYFQEVKKLKRDVTVKFAGVLLVILILSALFSLYALYPLKNALELTEEFIKDILHDFNTPLATLRLNVAMLKKEVGSNSKIKRIENSVQTILNLQANLRAYLNAHVAQKEEFLLKEFLEERVAQLGANYRHISFSVAVGDNVILATNKDSFTRIIDNLLTNAAKYNKQNGSVSIKQEGILLKIEDTGKGIQNPKRVFERFYKEQERGIGIGLHIVEKLCQELDIAISLESEVGKGTVFTLDLSKLVKV